MERVGYSSGQGLKNDVAIVQAAASPGLDACGVDPRLGIQPLQILEHPSETDGRLSISLTAFCQVLATVHLQGLQSQYVPSVGLISPTILDVPNHVQVQYRGIYKEDVGVAGGQRQGFVYRPCVQGTLIFRRYCTEIVGSGATTPTPTEQQHHLI